MGRTALGVLDIGGRRNIVALGRYFGSQSLVNRAQALHTAFEGWSDAVLAALRRISVVRKNLTASGNSAALTRRFSRAKRYKRLDSRIEHSVVELEAIAEEELVYTDEIPELKRRLRAEELEESRGTKESALLDVSDTAPGMELIRLTNRDQLRDQFRDHAESGRMIEGALDAYFSSGADSSRQALASCRSALELLVRQITGQPDWRTGLDLLAEGSRKKLVSQTYAYLSGYGSHPGGRPTKKDVAYGIRLTIACGLWLLEPSAGH